MSGGDADGWIMVKNRGDESEGRQLRVLRRCKGTDEAGANDAANSPQADDTESADTITDKCKDSKGYQSLVGAPIKMPQRELHSDFTISSKVGGSLHLDQCSLTAPELTVTSLSPPSVSHLDLSDASQWPSMGRQEGVVPQLGSWSTIVKKPVPVLQKKNQELETDAVKADEPVKEGRKSKRKKTAEREPFMLELGSLFEALEVKESKKLMLGTGGGTAISQRPKNLANANPTKPELVRTGNPMDSSAPSTRRGKEREVPKARKPSALRKVIIKEKLARCADRDVAKISEASSRNNERLGVSSDMQGGRISELPSIHSRKFREYCDHMLTEEINQEVEKLLSSLRHFQDRQYLKDPTKSKAKRRYVCGLREVLKHLKLRKLKCVIVPPNLDRVESEGGINEFVEQILELCHEQAIPYIFAMTRRRLACVLRKKHRIGCVGIFYYDGAEEHYKKIMELAESARQEYSGHIATSQPAKDLDSSEAGAVHSSEAGVVHSRKSLLTEACNSSTSSESEDNTKCTLNIAASEFVPAFNFALNVDAAVFTPSFLSAQNFCAT